MAMGGGCMECNPQLAQAPGRRKGTWAGGAHAHRTPTRPPLPPLHHTLHSGASAAAAAAAAAEPPAAAHLLGGLVEGRPRALARAVLHVLLLLQVPVQGAIVHRLDLVRRLVARPEHGDALVQAQGPGAHHPDRHGGRWGLRVAA